MEKESQKKGNQRGHALIGRRQFIVGAVGTLAMMGLTGCNPKSNASSAQGEAQSYKAGTYTAQSNGRKGPIEVQATFSDSSIENIEVLSSYETERIAARPFEDIPAQIVKYQSLDIDSISGATLASMAVLSATKNCVEQAGGNVQTLENAPAAEKSTETEELDADIIVIGAGAAGMGAAMAASQNDAKVVVFEKCGYTGGNALVSGGVLTYIDAPQDLRRQLNDGYQQFYGQLIDKSANYGVPQEIIAAIQSQWDEYYAAGNTTVFASPEFLALYSIVGFDLAYTDELWEEKVAFYTLNLDLMDWLSTMDELEWQSLGPVAGFPWPIYTRAEHGYCGEGYFYAFDATREARNLPIDILFSTPAEQLITEGDRVVGAEGMCTDGTTYRVHASKAVIIATGGFAGSKELLLEYDDEWGFTSDQNIPHDNNYGHTGDGLVMARDLGAAVRESDSNYMLLPCANAFDLSVEGIVGDSGNALMVNKSAQRFMDETQSRNSMSKLVMKQTDQIAYLISDKTNCGFTDGISVFGLDEENMINQGMLWRADTIEELAEKLGLEADTLSNTVNTYNQYAEAGVDTDFGRTLFTDSSPVKTAPFYGIEVTWVVHIINMGIQIDDGYHVINQTGEPIAGLYAVGEVTGAPGVDVMMLGMQLARSLTV